NPSVTSRHRSSFGEPIMNSPAGSATISGQTAQSLKLRGTPTATFVLLTCPRLGAIADQPSRPIANPADKILAANTNPAEMLYDCRIAVARCSQSSCWV